jgi:hypothetical protein
MPKPKPKCCRQVRGSCHYGIPSIVSTELSFSISTGMEYIYVLECLQWTSLLIIPYFLAIFIFIFIFISIVQVHCTTATHLSPLQECGRSQQNALGFALGDQGQGPKSTRPVLALALALGVALADSGSLWLHTPKDPNF